MTLEEFYEIRRPFYLDNNSLSIYFADTRHSNTSIAVWLNDIHYQYLHTIRGYYFNHEDQEFIMIYNNDYVIPNMSLNAISFLFTYFPTIQFIGVGAIEGTPGEIWKPKLKIIR